MAAVLYGTYMMDNGNRVLSSVGNCNCAIADCGDFQCSASNCSGLGQSNNQVYIGGTGFTRYNCNCQCA